MADLTPSLPGRHDFGQLTAASPLKPGMQCRWCPHPLGFALNHATGTATGVVGCCHCDNEPGSHI